MTVDLLARVAHVLFAGLWAGSVIYMALAVLPLARDGAFGTRRALKGLSQWLAWISRVSAVILLLTGGHLAAAGYTSESLVGTLEGQLVLAMTALWVALIALVEIGTKRIRKGLEAGKRREPAVKAMRPLQGAAAVAVLLLIVSGLLSGGL